MGAGDLYINVCKNTKNNVASQIQKKSLDRAPLNPNEGKPGDYREKNGGQGGAEFAL
jgi:hypothetical protein